jgi:hypothetical protein
MALILVVDDTSEPMKLPDIQTSCEGGKIAAPKRTYTDGGKAR